MKNLSLNKKLFGLILGLIVAGAVTGWLGLDRMARMNHGTAQMVGQNFPNVLAAEEMRDYARQIGIYERDFIMAANEADMHEAGKAMIERKEKLDKTYEELLARASDEEKPMLKSFRENMDSYWKTIQLEQATTLAKNEKGAFQIARTKGTELRGVAIKSLDDIVQYQKGRLEFRKAESDGLYRYGKVLVLAVLILSCIGGLGISSILLRSLMVSINRIIDSLSRASDEVAKASEQIASASEELSQSSNQQASALQETSSALEELTSMVAKNNDNAKHAAGNAHESLGNAESGKQTIQTMVGAIQELESSNQEIAEIVKVFGEIQEKTKVIEDIVFQTQLLSFNASVEAARAGEHGKGFAVVAEEVGNLAEMSGNASAEIGDLLQNSLKKVENTVEGIRTRITRLVEEGGKGMRAMESIVTGVQTSSSKANEIASASDEQSRGIEEINRAVTQLDQSTQQNAATSQQAAGAAQQLAGQAQTLRTTVQDLIFVVNGDGGHRLIERPKAAKSPDSKRTESKPQAGAKVIPISPRKKATAAGAPAAGAPGALKKAVGASEPSPDDPGFVDL